MRKELALVSYGLATIAGFCFISGLALMASERGM